MTDEEKEFLMNLFNRHELSLNDIICLLGSAASHMVMVAMDAGDKVVEQIMIDLCDDCTKYVVENMED